MPVVNQPRSGKYISGTRIAVPGVVPANRQEEQGWANTAVMFDKMYEGAIQESARQISEQATQQGIRAGRGEDVARPEKQTFLGTETTLSRARTESFNNAFANSLYVNSIQPSLLQAQNEVQLTPQYDEEGNAISASEALHQKGKEIIYNSISRAPESEQAALMLQGDSALAKLVAGLADNETTYAMNRQDANLSFRIDSGIANLVEHEHTIDSAKAEYNALLSTLQKTPGRINPDWIIQQKHKLDAAYLYATDYKKRLSEATFQLQTEIEGVTPAVLDENAANVVMTDLLNDIEDKKIHPLVGYELINILKPAISAANTTLTSIHKHVTDHYTSKWDIAVTDLNNAIKVAELDGVSTDQWNSNVQPRIERLADLYREMELRNVIDEDKRAGFLKVFQNAAGDEFVDKLTERIAEDRRKISRDLDAIDVALKNNDHAGFRRAQEKMNDHPWVRYTNEQRTRFDKLNEEAIRRDAESNNYKRFITGNASPHEVDPKTVQRTLTGNFQNIQTIFKKTCGMNSRYLFIQ